MTADQPLAGSRNSVIGPKLFVWAIRQLFDPMGPQILQIGAVGAE